jgi:hypothetical protein
MEDKTKSEDLYEELRKTLENESAVEKAVVADDQKSTPEKTDETKITEDGELTDEEISKLHPKAQKRIKELAEQVKTLAEKPAEKSPEESPKEDKPASNFKNVQEFLNAVEDEPSRNLLEKFYGVIKAETSTILAPVERANAEAKFNEEFSKYEKIEGLADYKNDLQKTFLRNPNQSLKALISETVTDITLNKIKPTETSPSLPNRSGDIDLDKLSTDELREKLDSMRGN